MPHVLIGRQLTAVLALVASNPNLLGVGNKVGTPRDLERRDSTEDPLMVAMATTDTHVMTRQHGLAGDATCIIGGTEGGIGAHVLGGIIGLGLDLPPLVRHFHPRERDTLQSVTYPFDTSGQWLHPPRCDRSLQSCCIVRRKW